MHDHGRQNNRKATAINDMVGVIGPLAKAKSILDILAILQEMSRESAQRCDICTRWLVQLVQYYQDDEVRVEVI